MCENELPTSRLSNSYCSQIDRHTHTHTHNQTYSVYHAALQGSQQKTTPLMQHFNPECQTPFSLPAIEMRATDTVETVALKRSEVVASCL